MVSMSVTDFLFVCFTNSTKRVEIEPEYTMSWLNKMGHMNYDLARYYFNQQILKVYNNFYLAMEAKSLKF